MYALDSKKNVRTQQTSQEIQSFFKIFLGRGKATKFLNARKKLKKMKIMKIELMKRLKYKSNLIKCKIK